MKDIWRKNPSMNTEMVNLISSTCIAENAAAEIQPFHVKIPLGLPSIEESLFS